MNRRLTALFAAFETLLVVAIGVAIPLVPLTALWAFQYGLQLDWSLFWRAAVDTWLLGHGVDVRFTLDAATAAALGVPGAETPVPVTIAPLGFALLTLLLGVRAGRRIGETRNRLLGELVSLATFAAASLALAFSALHADARPSLWQGALLPTAVYTVGLAIGVRTEVDAAGGRVRAWFDSWPTRIHRVAVTALTGGTAAAAAVLAIAAVVTAAAILFSYAEIIALYQSLQSGALGGAALTLGQLAMLPNAVIWAASWLIGPGFSIGTGSMVSPLGTSLGPIPAVPLLGALPSGELAYGFVGLAVPLATAFLVGAVLGPRVKRELDGIAVVVAGVASGIVGGGILGLLAWASSGAAGPGRLVDVGPDPWAVGGWAALQLAIGCTGGLLASRRGIARR